MATFKNTPFYVGPKKLGEIEQWELSFMSQGEQIISADETTESTGTVTSEGSFDTVKPVGSGTVDLEALVINQTPVEVGVGPIQGKFYKVSGKLLKTTLSSAVKTGLSKGKYTFRGGTPKAI